MPTDTQITRNPFSLYINDFYHPIDGSLASSIAFVKCNNTYACSVASFLAIAMHFVATHAHTALYYKLNIYSYWYIIVETTTKLYKCEIDENNTKITCLRI